MAKPKRKKVRRGRGQNLHGVILLTLLSESAFVVVLGFDSRFAALFAGGYFY